ncbi:hypothetical protein BZA77DRAFT_307614 [Pyronema omphalodes]|nr:hypothetical protein BZA77DRAFT_307614 [Pyronema omphalodes]
MSCDELRCIFVGKLRLRGSNCSNLRYIQHFQLSKNPETNDEKTNISNDKNQIQATENEQRNTSNETQATETWKIENRKPIRSPSAAQLNSAQRSNKKTINQLLIHSFILSPPLLFLCFIYPILVSYACRLVCLFFSFSFFSSFFGFLFIFLFLFLL